MSMDRATEKRGQLDADGQEMRGRWACPICGAETTPAMIRGEVAPGVQECYEHGCLTTSRCVDTTTDQFERGL